MGNKNEALAHADAALKIFEELELPFRNRAQDVIEGWREEEKAQGKAAE
jgi:hypothetical protein